jgi:predicted permease
METPIRDIKHAVRGLCKAPAFALTAIVILALGIGSTTSIFSLAYTVLLQSLPVANPEQLYRLGKEPRCCYQGGFSQDGEFSLVSYDLYAYFRDNTQGFSELAAFQAYPNALFGVRSPASTEPARSRTGEFVSGNYFATFGIGAHAGRTLGADDDRPDAPLVTVMSYRLWQQEYGSDPSIVGSVLDIDGKPFTVVGITPPGFFGDTLRSRSPDFFLPLNAEPQLLADADLNKADTHWLNVMGRIDEGTAAEAIQAEMRVELKQWLRSHWGEMSPNDRAAFDRQTLYLSPGGAGIPALRARYEHWLHILMMVSAFVLLIVCANTASLMLVRGIERRPRMSLSVALGARASTLVRQALTESVVLSVLGGAAGLLVAVAGTRLILHFALASSEGFVGTALQWPSVPVLLFAFAVSLMTGIAFGIAPACMAARAEPIEALRGAGHRVTPGAGSVPRKTLVVFQAALSLALLSATGLLSATLYELEHQDFGFDQDRRTVVEIEPRLAGYRTNRLPPLYRRIQDAMANIPGVASVALALYSPQSGNRWGARISVDGQSSPATGTSDPAWWNRVTSGYFDVVGTPVVSGRGISQEDSARSRRVAVINEAFARTYFENRDPIGKYFGTQPGASRQFEVVGIVKDALYGAEAPGGPVQPFFFLPEAQADYAQGNLGSLFLHDIVILTEPGASLSMAQVRNAMASADPDLPVVAMRSLKEQVAGQFTQQRLIARLTALFSVVALVLSSIGLYGLTAYNAGSRTHEIAMRMALGADRGRILALVLRGAIALIAYGVMAGLPLALAAGAFLGHQLYGLSPYDPTVNFVAIAVLGAAGVAAALIPAFRATRASPLEALRHE